MQGRFWVRSLDGGGVLVPEYLLVVGVFVLLFLLQIRFFLFAFFHLLSQVLSVLLGLAGLVVQDGYACLLWRRTYLSLPWTWHEIVKFLVCDLLSACS